MPDLTAPVTPPTEPTRPNLKADYTEHGFVVARGLFSSDEVERVKQHFAEIAAGPDVPGFWEPNRTADKPGERFPRVIMPHRWDDFTRRWLLDSRWRPLLTDLVGEETLAALSMFYFKPPGSPGQALH